MYHSKIWDKFGFWCYNKGLFMAARKFLHGVVSGCVSTLLLLVT